jgi:hypothetical protein
MKYIQPKDRFCKTYPLKIGVKVTNLVPRNEVQKDIKITRNVYYVKH